MATLFYEKRANLFVMRKYFDKLRIDGRQNTRKEKKGVWAEKVRDAMMTRMCFNSLALYTKKKVKSRHAESLCQMRMRQSSTGSRQRGKACRRLADLMALWV